MLTGTTFLYLHRHGRPFHQTLTECAELYLRPCLRFQGPQSMLSDCALLENALALIEHICSAHELLVVTGTVKKWEYSIHRVAIFACIWTFGVGSPSGRAAFQSWFYQQFANDMKATAEDRIFPAGADTSTSECIFDYSLAIVGEESAYLEWVCFDRAAMAGALEWPTQGGGAYLTTEERLKRSYRNLYYTTLQGAASDKAGIIVPTPTGAACHILQGALMRVGGQMMVAGAPGTGKSMLLRQLLALSKCAEGGKLAVETAARWVCHVSDCSGSELLRHIDNCRASLTPLLKERKVQDKGFVIIDDLNVDTLPEGPTSAEYLRSLHVGCAKEVYHTSQQSWSALSKFFTLAAARSTNTPNKRVLRHYAVVCCDGGELSDVFAVKVQACSELMTSDVAHDLAVVTLGFARAARTALTEAPHQHSAELTGHHHRTSALHAPDQHFLLLNGLRSESALANYILSKVVAGLDTMGGYTSNDVVRAWDRTVADYFVRHRAFAELCDSAQDHATNAYSYQYASFTSYLDKERVQRGLGLEALQSTLYNNTAVIEYPLSYKLGASGFYDSKAGIYPGLACAESVRDVLLKRYGPSMVPRCVRAKSLAFWTDVMAISAELAAGSMGGHGALLLLTGTNPRLHQAALSVVCVYLQGQYCPLRVDPASFASPAETVEPSDSNGYREALADCLIEALLLDQTVLKSLKLLRRDMYGASVDDPLLPADAFSSALSVISEPHADLMRRVVAAYESAEATASFVERRKSFDKADTPILTVWHLLLTQAFCKESGCWSFLHDTVRLRSAYMLERLLAYGDAVNPLINAGVRDAIAEFLSRQRFVVTLHDDGWTEEVLHDVSAVPNFVTSLRVLPCYESYHSDDGGLAELVSAESAHTVVKLVAQCSADCCTRLRAAHLSSQADTVATDAYRAETLLTIATMYERIHGFAGVAWKKRLSKNIKLFAVAERAEAANDALQSVSPEQRDELPRPVSNQEDEAGIVDLQLLGDVVACVLVVRYAAVLQDTAAASTATLIQQLKEVGLTVTISPAVSLETLMLAITATLMQFEGLRTSSAAAGNPSLLSCLAAAAALPAASPTRQLLASLGLLLACGQHVVLHDLTCCVSFILHRLLFEGAAPTSSLQVGVHYIKQTIVGSKTSVEVASTCGHDNRSARRWKTLCSSDADVTVTMFAICAHSPLLQEVGALYAAQLLGTRIRQPVFETIRQLCQTARELLTLDTVSTEEGAVLVSCDAAQFAEDWIELSLRVTKPLNTLAASLQAQCSLPSTRGERVMASWDEFDSILTALVAHDQTRSLSMEALLSVAIVKHMEWLHRLLSSWEYASLLLSILLNLKLDTTSPSGQHMAQRILHNLLTARHQEVGIVPLAEVDDVMDDASESSTSSLHSGTLQEKSHEGSDSEDELGENFRLSDASVDSLKQTLLAIAQALSSGGGRHGTAALWKTTATTHSSAATNAAILSDIRKNVEEWVLWVIDVHDLDMPYKGDYIPTWLDRIAVAVNLKPLAVNATVMAGIVDLGLELDNVPVHTDIGAAALRKRDQQRSASMTILVVSASSAKDTVCELEHGGDVSTLTDFSLTFAAARQLRGTARNALRQSIVITATRQSVMITSAQAQQESALKAALLMQEQDKCVHHYLCPAGATAAQLQALLTDESLQAEALLDTEAAQSRELTHYVVVTHPCHAVDGSVRSILPAPAADELQLVEVPSSVQRVFMPTTPVVVPPTVAMQVYTDYLRYCFHVVASVPIHCPAGVSAIVHRVRWLLVLFHTSVQCKLASWGMCEPIGVDTLVQACVAVDTLLTRAYHNAPKDGFLNPKQHSARRQSQTHSHPVSASQSRRSSSVHALSVAHSAPPVVLDERVEPRSEVQRLDVLAWSLDMLVVEIVDCLYSKLTPVRALKDSIRAIYMCYFTTGSLNPSAEYLVKGKVVLPHDLQRHAADRFFREIREYSQDDASFVELADSTLAEANSVSLQAAYRAMEHINGAFHHHLEEHTLAVREHIHGPALLQRALSQYDALQRVRKVLYRMLAHLPAAINMDAADIQARMSDHRKNMMKGSGGGGGDLPRGAPPAASEYTMRRRRAERIVVTFDTREFDPLWAYLLCEAQMFNKTVTALRKSVSEALDSPLHLLRYVAQRGVDMSLLPVQASLARTLQALQAGLVPHHLSGHAVRVDDWCRELVDQQAQLLEWLTSGCPGKLRLHLLHNPRGLLYAMKETFCMRTDNVLDRVHLSYRVQEPGNVLQGDPFTISKTNFGCSVILSDLYLHNALFQEKANTLEFLPEHSASAYGKVRSFSYFCLLCILSSADRAVRTFCRSWPCWLA
jgi:hypothetical protein